MSDKKIYTVATSHLDTIWSWDFETTVSKYIYNTLVDNFALFKKYPTYIFSFEGAYRYELMEEYYPDLYKEMKKFIKSGRWNVTGSAYENGDVNVPSPEALFRNILYGNSYFDKKFGKRSVDIYLPDCFGFGWALPSVANHANLKGFTTQKLAWGSAYGVPFDIGKWYGVDGNYIYASLNPHDYYFTLTKLRDWDFVQDKLKENEKYDLDWTYMFHGIGDRGGAPEEKSVAFVEQEINKNDSSDIKVIAAPADKIFRDIDNELDNSVRDNLPQWKTELVMQNHAVGGYTSRAIGKRWNRRCEELADMAERAGVASSYLGVCEYNDDVIDRSWKRFIAHQFHDDIPGTSVQRAYKRSWNDYALSMNQLAGETEASLAPITKLMKSDTCQGIPVMVSNPIEAPRTGAVTVRLKNINAPYVRVYNEKGREVKSQINSVKDGVMEIVFIAEVESYGFKVYDIRPSAEPCLVKSEISIGDNIMENQKYIVEINKRGNITSIIDKEDGDRQILSSPIVLGLFNYTGSKSWPAWEMNYKQAAKEPDRLPNVVSVTVVEKGPARVAFEVKQKDGNSEFNFVICLTDSCDVVEVYTEIEWCSMRTLAKQRFAFTAENEKATFDLGLGAIQRGNMSEKLFEVPAQKWADITDKSGEFGVSVISECKYGWDKYNDNTLRLTAIHTPKRNYRIDSMQSMMDLGLNRYSFAVFSHKGEVGEKTQLEARKFIQPMAAVVFERHKGVLGKSYSFMSVSSNDIIVRAVKKAADGDEIIVRLNEGANKAVDEFTLTAGEGIESARELYASEEYKDEATVKDGKLVTSFKPYEIKTFALKLKSPKKCGALNRITPVELEYNCKYITKQNKKNNEFMYHIPYEIIPERIVAFGGEFNIQKAGGKNAMRCEGQEIKISDNADVLKLLCTSHTDNDAKAKFIIDGEVIEKTVNSDEQLFARWDLYDFGETAYIKKGHLGYEATHAHDSVGKDIYAKNMYTWVITLDVKGKNTVTLPNNPDLIVLSACQVENGYKASLVTQLYDEVEQREFTYKKTFKEKLWYFESKLLWNINDTDDYFRHNNNGKNGKRVEQSKRHTKSRTVETVGH